MSAVPTRAVAALPHWDLSGIFPDVDSSELEAAQERALLHLRELQELFDKHGIRRSERGALTDADVTHFEQALTAFNALLEEVHVISAFLRATVDCDAENDQAQARLSEWQQQLIPLRQLDLRFDAWLGSLDVPALIERSIVAREHAFALERSAEAARHQMAEGEENLAAHLTLSGGSAWVKLHRNVSSRLTVRVPFPNGEERELPMPAVRMLAYDADPAVRERAYRTEVKAWQGVAVPLAAALNGVKGEVSTLSARRGWETPLDQALFSNAIDRDTLAAMQKACEESFPDFRRYLRAKARLLGRPALPWWDLFAPLESPEDASRWTFASAAAFVEEQFGTYSPALAGLVQRAVVERWIDAEPRVGKVDGAYCMRIRRDESRMLMNFKPAFGSVQTMAHELGHAYHNTQLAGYTPLQRATPMALAETASIFCERIVTMAAIAHAPPSEQLAILEESLQNACQVIVDIHSRYLFEQTIFGRRRQRELSVDELNEAMTGAQRATYGDGLDPSTYHPYMWAVKGHYYSTDRSFYNWPYAFGLLFGLGLIEHYRRAPEQFREGYDRLLASTGLARAQELAGRFGIDLRAPDFWRASLDVIRSDIERFEALSVEQTGR